MAKKAAKSPKPSVGSDFAILRELIKLLDNSSVATIKLQRGGATYEVSRGAGGAAIPVVHAAAAAPAAANPAGGAASPAAPSGTVPAVAGAASNLMEIKSPMVGTFYRAPEPGAEPYVKVSSRVSPGQTLCIIEAMKIMNELESEVSGAVREILVEDAQPVEFGQVLFRVEPYV